jgi:hypothetical protein
MAKSLGYGTAPNPTYRACLFSLYASLSKYACGPAATQNLPALYPSGFFSPKQ